MVAWYDWGVCGVYLADFQWIGGVLGGVWWLEMELGVMADGTLQLGTRAGNLSARETKSHPPTIGGGTTVSTLNNHGKTAPTVYMRGKHVQT